MLANSYYTTSAVRHALAEFGITAEPELAEQIRKYAEILALWSRKVNLTAVRAPREVLRRHFGESMFGAQYVDKKAVTLIDVGSGAGFPGLPIKMLRPALRVKLLEPNVKKATFLGEVVRALNVAGVEILRVRAEDLQLGDSERVDCVTARAVGGFGSLLESSARLLRPGGQIVLWLGSEDASSVGRSTPATQWLWDSPVSVPCSHNRVILTGRSR